MGVSKVTHTIYVDLLSNGLHLPASWSSEYEAWK